MTHAFRSLRIALALSATLGAVSFALPAHAGDPAAAEVLFQEGRAASDRGDIKTACAKFHESNRLDPAIGTVFNLGDCEEKLGHVATAWRFFREVVQRLPPSDERVPIARDRATALEKRIPKLTLRLAPDSPPGTRVLRDGVELGDASMGSSLPVDPGAHMLEVVSPKGPAKKTEVSVAEGEQKTIELTVATESSAPPPAATTGNGRRTAGYIVGGIGAAGLLTGIVTGVMALGKKSTVDDHCAETTKRCDREGFDAAESGGKLATVSTIGLAVGVVGLGAGAYLLLSGESGKREGTAFVPAVGPGGLSLGVRHRF
jgi:hypothetical protein